jgi:phospholipase/carboxylesterase
MPRTRRSVLPYYYSQTPQKDCPLEVDAALFSTGLLDFPHALFAPLHYAPGYSYPLIIWLHGSGSDERQLQRIMPVVSMQNYVAVAPRGIPLATADQSASVSYGWQQTADHIQHAEQRVFESVELARQKLNVDLRRVFLAGFDSGGTMAMRLALSHPSRFAGVLSLCGSLPTGGTPLGNLIGARRLALFLATGRASVDYPAEQVCDDLRLLHTAGLSVTLRQYPCGHELQPQMLADVNRWIMEQINPPRPASAESPAEWSREVE